MARECCSSRRLDKRVARAASWSILPGLLLALAPKCPLCLAAYLSVLGVGAGAATLISPWLRPVAIALLLAIGMATILAWYRNGRRDREAFLSSR